MSEEHAKGPKSAKDIYEQYVIGGRDDQNYEITRVYAINPEYVIYRTKMGVRYYTNDDHLELDELILFKRLSRIRVSLAEVKSLQEGFQTTEIVDSLIATGVVAAFSEDYESAETILEKARDQLIRLKLIDGRIRYITGTILVSILILLSCLIFGVLFYYFDQVSSLKYISEYLMVCCYGTLGGFLSIASTLKNLDIDPNSALRVLGGSRILLAATSSLTIYFAIKADIVFGSFVLDSSGNISVPEGIWAMRFLLVASGFSERLVPNVIPQVINTNSDSMN